MLPKKFTSNMHIAESKNCLAWTIGSLVESPRITALNHQIIQQCLYFFNYFWSPFTWPKWVMAVIVRSRERDLNISTGHLYTLGLLGAGHVNRLPDNTPVTSISLALPPLNPVLVHRLKS